jgi:hypothetical protein
MSALVSSSSYFQGHARRWDQQPIVQARLAKIGHQPLLITSALSHQLPPVSLKSPVIPVTTLLRLFFGLGSGYSDRHSAGHCHLLPVTLCQD